MKKITLLFMFISYLVSAQNFEGAYKFVDDDVHGLWLFQDGYAVQTFYKDSEYIRTNGGKYQQEKHQLKIQIAFDDVLPEKIGTNKKVRLIFEGENFVDDEGRIWIKQPEISSELVGAFRITGRYIDGNFIEIGHQGTRMTLKILTDGFFQWIAFDSGKDQFFGTGGGVFTFEKGKYTENILFFSRDNSRVGAELQFDGKIVERDWHHKGRSSKGDPLHEIWTRL